MKVHYIHIRARDNGIAMPNGGYTIALTMEIKPGAYVLNMAKCPDDRPYEMKRGADVSRARLAGEVHMTVPTRAALQELCNRLSDKVSTGDLRVSVSLSHIPELS